MSIQEITDNIKRLLGNRDAFIGLVLLLVSITSFWLGRASVEESKPNIVLQNDAAVAAAIPEVVPERADQVGLATTATSSATMAVSIPEQNEKQYVASKNGTKYHLPWCPGAQQIKETNKVWFGSKEEAERAGYTAAGNCKGI